MSKKRSIFIPCEAANHTCDKSQYREASLWEQIKLNIHLIYCTACRKYSKDNKTLTKLTSSPNIHYLNAREKEKMKKAFFKELRNI
ncbi:MAG: hypothetical protein HRT67_00945 [Flavobacteriaceae bacterium]|nr:hypothetical protein [Flavobacteriaceae bacterium]